MSAHVLNADCLAALRDMPDASVDAIVTDPPYGLSNTTPAQVAETITRWASGDREYLPTSVGFMGHEWDGFVPPVAVWDECLRVLKPGGHLLAFAGSRTHDLMTLGIRLAGFEIRDSVAWLYGSGFPKSMDVSKAIDKGGALSRPRALEFTAWMRSTGITSAQINTSTDSNMGGHYLTDASQPAVATADMFDKLRPLLPEVPERIERLVAERTGIEWTDCLKRPATGNHARGLGVGASGPAGRAGGGERRDIPATDAAREWEGWGTAMKPAMEPVTWARKPFSVVPLESEATRLHHMIGALLWLSLSPAKRAELLSTSNHPAPHEATCVSARVNAGIARSLDASGETGTFSSPEVASISWSIATSWNSILGALSGKTKTCTTSTRSSTTTALKTLCSLLAPLTSPNTMPPCACLTGGRPSDATNAAESSSDDWSNWMHTLSASAHESATGPIGRAVASALADIADSLSGDLEAGSSADNGAMPTTVENEPSGSIDHITLARKPLTGTVAANVLEHGTGALNIDASRIGGPSGRWPANVVLDESQAAELDQQSGNVKSGGNSKRHKRTSPNWGGYSGGSGIVSGAEHPPSEGGASRYFYVAKAPKSERPVVDGIAHSTVKPLTLMRWLVRMVTPPGGTVLDPFAGSGTTLEAAILEGFDSVGIEREADYLPLIQARIERATTALAAQAEADADTLFPIDGAAS